MGRDVAAVARAASGNVRARRRGGPARRTLAAGVSEDARRAATCGPQSRQEGGADRLTAHAPIIGCGGRPPQRARPSISGHVKALTDWWARLPLGLAHARAAADPSLFGRSRSKPAAGSGRSFSGAESAG